MTDSRTFGNRPLHRRAFLLGAAASAATAVLAACGGEVSATATPGATIAPTRPVSAPTAAATTGVATVAPPALQMGNATVVTWFAGRDTTGYTLKQVAAFNSANRGIRVDYQEQGATTTDLKDKFTLVATAKDGAADIVSADVPFVPEFAAAGWTLPVDELLPPGERSQFYPGTLEGATYTGGLYAVPWFNNGPGLFYRKDLFEAAGLKAPKSYDEFLQAGLKLQKPGVDGFLTQLSQGEQGIISWFEFLWGSSGDLVDDKMNVIIDKDSKGAEALQYLIDLVYKHKVVPEAALQTKVSSDVTVPFRDGKGAMLRIWYSQVSTFEASDTAIFGKWDVAPLPSKDGMKPGPGCLGTWNLAVSKFSKKPKESFEVVRWLTSMEQQTARALAIGNLPTRSAVFDNAEIKAKYPYVESLKQSLAGLKSRPVTPLYSEISASAIQPNYGAAMTRRKTPEQAIRDMATEMRKILQAK